MSASFGFSAFLLLGLSISAWGEQTRALKFRARTPEESASWQAAARQKLFVLMMGGKEPDRLPLEAKVLRRLEVPAEGYALEEISVQTLPDRRAHAWLARPIHPRPRQGQSCACMVTVAAAKRLSAERACIGTAVNWRKWDMWCSRRTLVHTNCSTPAGH